MKHEVNTTEYTNQSKSNSLIDMVKKMVDIKLNESQLNKGWLYGKELMYILNCSERTLIRWRKERKQGNIHIGISCIKIMGQYQYPIEAIYKYFLTNVIA